MAHYNCLILLAALLSLVDSDGMAQTFKGLTSTEVQPLRVISLVSEPIEPPIESIKRKDGKYAVLLINSTRMNVRRVRIDGGAWVSSRQIKRTCDRSDFQWCIENKQWALLATLDCGSEYSIEIQMTDFDGVWHRSKESWSLFADCEFLGGVLGMIE
jgi:hypothetical protein